MDHQPVNAQYPWSLSHPGLVPSDRSISAHVTFPCRSMYPSATASEIPWWLSSRISQSKIAGGVTVFDCVDEASFDCAIPQIVDAGDLASNVAYPPNNRSSMPHPLGLTRNGDPAWHVRSTQLTGVERRYRRRCRPGSFESTGDRRAAEHRVTTRRLYERGGQRG